MREADRTIELEGLPGAGGYELTLHEKMTSEHFWVLFNQNNQHDDIQIRFCARKPLVNERPHTVYKTMSINLEQAKALHELLAEFVGRYEEAEDAGS